MSAAPLFIYLHIPKTGGSTLGQVIYNQYNDGSYSKSEGGFLRAGVYYLPDGFIRKPGEEFNADELRVFQRPDVNAIAGHFSHDICQHLTRPTRCFTLLRDPVQRVLSLYHHLKQYEQLPEEVSLERFVQEPYHQEACNDQTRRIAGTNPAAPCDQATLEQAKANLQSSIDLAGITERFDASLLLARRVFGWNEQINYLPQLVNTKRREQRDQAVPQLQAELIQTHNALDVELYRFANELLDQRIAQAGPSFTSELEAYAAKNRELLDTHGPASTLS